MDSALFDAYPFHTQLIKGEPLAANLISPSVSPSPSSSASAVSLTLPVSVSRRKSISTSSSLAGPKRVRPYPRTNNSRKEDNNMSTGYEWTHGARSTHGRSLPSSSERRSLEGAYTQGSYIQDYNNVMGSSSLNGAMNMAADATTHSRQSRSPASSHSGSGYTGNLSSNNDMTWHQNTNIMISSSTDSYPGVAGHGGPYSMTMDDSFPLTTAARNVSPKSLSSPSPPYAANHGHNGGHNAHSGSSMMYGPGSMGQYASTSTSDYQPQNQSQSDKELIRHLQTRVRQLEEQCQQQAQQQAKAAAYGNQTASGLPPALPSSHFQRQWKSRTDARTRIFCSLNRAGNALCSWHDSRRERRQFPPRNAPPGYLNCGCTFEEALFEESLARHKVGSYHPGDSVRMDPALRNPLLKLLVARYGYKDGDFDHDPLTEAWDEGEDPVSWEQKAHSGAHMRRRNENAH